jgi:hypothetical protein
MASVQAIKIKVPDVSENIQSYVGVDYSSGTTLYVDSSKGLVSGNYICVGEPGLEGTEITPLTASPPSTTSLTITAMQFSHAKGTPISLVNWDKYSLEYRTAILGSWTAYGGMPATLIYDAQYNEYRDTAATATYAWRYRYYSTENSAYSDYSDIITATGWPSKSVGAMIRNIRKIANDPDGKSITDEEIIGNLNTGQGIVYSLYDRWWFLLKDGTAIDTVASQVPYALPSDFGRMHSVHYNLVEGTSDVTYNLKYISMVEFDYESQDNNASADDNIKYYCIYPGDSTSPTGYLRVWPKPETAGLHITPRYFKTMTELVDYADETEIPIPNILENYAISIILAGRKEDDKAAIYDKLFREQITLLKLMQRKQAGPPRQLWKYVGRKADERLYGNGNLDSNVDREVYW